MKIVFTVLAAAVTAAAVSAAPIVRTEHQDVAGLHQSASVLLLRSEQMLEPQPRDNALERRGFMSGWDKLKAGLSTLRDDSFDMFKNSLLKNGMLKKSPKLKKLVKLPSGKKLDEALPSTPRIAPDSSPRLLDDETLKSPPRMLDDVILRSKPWTDDLDLARLERIARKPRPHPKLPGQTNRPQRAWLLRNIKHQTPTFPSLYPIWTNRPRKAWVARPRKALIARESASSVGSSKGGSSASKEDNEEASKSSSHDPASDFVTAPSSPAQIEPA